MTVTTDRRVGRTRRRLTQALLELILQRGYDRITVQDILDRADVGRSTFYAHYRDKQDLLLSCFDDLREEVHRELDAAVPGSAVDVGTPAAALFTHAYGNRRVYRAMCGRQGGTVVHAHLHVLVRDALTARLAPHLIAAGSDTPPEIVAEFAASALLGLLIWWVRQDFPIPPSAMAGMYRDLATPGILAPSGIPALP